MSPPFDFHYATSPTTHASALVHIRFKLLDAAERPRRGGLLFRNGQSRFGQIDGIPADHDFECSRLDDAVHVAIQEAKLLEAERELHGFCLAGIEADPAEAAQLFDGPRHRADFIADVQLNDFVSPDSAGVGYGYADLGRSFGADSSGRQTAVVVFEGRIAQAPAKGKERLRG